MVRTDQEILALGQARDQEAIAAMAEKYGAYCHTVARNVLGNDADAEECVNDAYLAVWNAIPRAQPQNLLAYLAKTTRNIALRRLEHDQAQKRDSRLHLLLDELAEVLPGEGSVEDEAAQGWVYYTARQEAGRGTALWARNLATGEAVPLLERCNITGLVTDGTWCYCTNGSTTDCYRLDWDGQGRPTGLVLVESAL